MKSILITSTALSCIRSLKCTFDISLKWQYDHIHEVHRGYKCPTDGEIGYFISTLLCKVMIRLYLCTESRGRVVTRWPGSQEVGGSFPGCATKFFVRCKNLAFNIGECVSRGSDTT